MQSIQNYTQHKLHKYIPTAAYVQWLPLYAVQSQLAYKNRFSLRVWVINEKVRCEDTALSCKLSS